MALPDFEMRDGEITVTHIDAEGFALQIKLTDEGVIHDVFEDGVSVATRSQTYDELMDELCKEG